jgi:hypothetical protein
VGAAGEGRIASHGNTGTLGKNGGFKQPDAWKVTTIKDVLILKSQPNLRCT